MLLRVRRIFCGKVNKKYRHFSNIRLRKAGWIKQSNAKSFYFSLFKQLLVFLWMKKRWFCKQLLAHFRQTRINRYICCFLTASSIKSERCFKESADAEMGLFMSVSNIRSANKQLAMRKDSPVRSGGRRMKKRWSFDCEYRVELWLYRWSWRSSSIDEGLIKNLIFLPDLLLSLLASIRICRLANFLDFFYSLDLIGNFLDSFLFSHNTFILQQVFLRVQPSAFQHWGLCCFTASFWGFRQMHDW